MARMEDINVKINADVNWRLNPPYDAFMELQDVWDDVMKRQDKRSMFVPFIEPEKPAIDWFKVARSGSEQIVQLQHDVAAQARQLVAQDRLISVEEHLRLLTERDQAVSARK